MILSKSRVNLNLKTPIKSNNGLMNGSPQIVKVSLRVFVGALKVMEKLKKKASMLNLFYHKVLSNILINNNTV